MNEGSLIVTCHAYGLTDVFYYRYITAIMTCFKSHRLRIGNLR